jgi:hypothetical protein
MAFAIYRKIDDKRNGTQKTEKGAIGHIRTTGASALISWVVIIISSLMKKPQANNVRLVSTIPR